MAFAEDKAVPVGPLGLRRPEAQKRVKQDLHYFHRRECSANMPFAAGLQNADDVAPKRFRARQ